MQLEDVFVSLYSILCKYLRLRDLVRVCCATRYLASRSRTSVVNSTEFRRVFGRVPNSSPIQLRLYYVYSSVLVGLCSDEWSGCATALSHVIWLRLQPPATPSCTSLPQTVEQYRTWRGMLRSYERECQNSTCSQRLLDRLLECTGSARAWVVPQRTLVHANVAFVQLWKFRAQETLPMHSPNYSDCPPLFFDTPGSDLCPDCAVRQRYLHMAFRYAKFKHVLHHHLVLG